MARTYKMRSFKNGQNKSGEAFINYSLTVPTPLAEKLIDEFDNLAFEIELTKEGILYRPVEAEDSVPNELPFKASKRTNGAKASTGSSKPAPKAKASGTKAAPKAKANGSKTKAAPKAKATAPKRPSAPKAKASGSKPAPKAPSRPKPRAKATA